jgi:predicted dehydrogenase
VVDVLIVGPGAIARRHVENFRNAGARVVAVAGRDLRRARAFADELGIPHAFEGHQAALAATHAEIVSVATPPAAHAEITIDALDAGRHVLCEKPFSMTAAEARSMVEASERNQRLLGCWSSRHQFMWGFETAIAAAAKGTLGRILHIDVDFQWRDLIPGISYQPECRFFLDKSQNGGGVLADWGSYWIDMVLAMVPDAQARWVLGSTYLGIDQRPLPADVVRDAEEWAQAMITFDTGANATVSFASRVHQDTRHEFRVWGTEGGMAFNPFDTGPEATVTWWRDVDGEMRTEQLIADGPRSMHDGPAADFVAAVAEGRPPAAPGQRAAQVVAITEAIYRSADESRPVEVER